MQELLLSDTHPADVGVHLRIMALCAVHPIAHGSSLRPCAQKYDKSAALATAVSKARAVKHSHVTANVQGFENGFCTKTALTSSDRVLRRGVSSPCFKDVSGLRCSRDDRGSCDAAEHRSEEPFREAIFELEIMVREPAEVLGGMQERLSAKDLELVLTYFAQEGRDSWCALEVYEWMQKENRVRDETQKLMMSIMYEWVMKLVEGERSVEEVKSLLQDMYCVGLKPEFHIIQGIISSYYDRGRKVDALCFVKKMLEIGVDDDAEDPVSILVFKMVRSGEQKEAVDVVRTLRGCGFELRLSAYSAALLAIVKEQEQFTMVQRQVRILVQNGTLQELEKQELEAFATYENLLHQEAEEIVRLAEKAGTPDKMSSFYERLLAMYCIAGKGLEAERALWQMKFSGREPPMEMYNTVVGVCGYGNHREAAFRVLRRMEDMGPVPTKKTYSVLIGGFHKGGHYREASEAFQLMLTRGLRPDPHVMLAVLRSLQKAGLVSHYLHLCKTLAQVGMIEPCLLYFYIDALNLCIIRALD